MLQPSKWQLYHFLCSPILDDMNTKNISTERIYLCFTHENIHVYTQNLQLALGTISIVTYQVGHKVRENPWNFKAWGLFSILGWNMEAIGILWASLSSDKQVKCLSLSSMYWIAFRFKIQWKDGFSSVSMTISSHWSLSARIHGLQELFWVSEGDYIDGWVSTLALFL